MLIDIHRHAADLGKADRVVRNLFPEQIPEIEPGKLYSLGLHPWHLDKENIDSALKEVRIHSTHPQVIAIGETGLDKAIRIPWEQQLYAFKAQIEIACQVNKPMIIHCVKAYNEVCEHKIKSGSKQSWVIHWFNAGLEMAEQLIDKGFYLSFGHMLFNESSKAYKTFFRLPVNRIFLETDDAGYTINEIYDKAASLLSIPESELYSIVETNFRNCFVYDTK